VRKTSSVSSIFLIFIFFAFFLNCHSESNNNKSAASQSPTVIKEEQTKKDSTFFFGYQSIAKFNGKGNLKNKALVLVCDALSRANENPSLYYISNSWIADTLEKRNTDTMQVYVYYIDILKQHEAGIYTLGDPTGKCRTFILNNKATLIIDKYGWK
jgi:hypothetical protein